MILGTINSLRWMMNAQRYLHATRLLLFPESDQKKHRTIILITIVYDLSDLATKTISLQQLCESISSYFLVCLHYFLVWTFWNIFQKCSEFHILIICELMSMKDTTFIREFQLNSKWKHFNSIVPLLKCHFYKGKPGFSSFNLKCVHIDNS